MLVEHYWYGNGSIARPALSLSVEYTPTYRLEHRLALACEQYPGVTVTQTDALDARCVYRFTDPDNARPVPGTRWTFCDADGQPIVTYSVLDSEGS